MPAYTKRFSAVPRVITTFRLEIAPSKPSHPDAPAPYRSEEFLPVIWCVYADKVLPKPEPKARLFEILRSAALNTIDNCTEDGVGLFKFLFTSRNFLQPVPTTATIARAEKKYIKYFLLIIEVLLNNIRSPEP